MVLDPVKSLAHKRRKGNIPLKEHTRHKKEHWHMEGVDQFVSKRGCERKIVMPHHNQCDANPFCNIHVLNSFFHHRCFGNWFNQFC